MTRLFIRKLLFVQLIEEIWTTFKSENNTDINNTILACYGDKETDAKAYLGTGISASSVFIVNGEGGNEIMSV